MAAKIKGEVSFRALSAGFVLVLDFNALCTIEEELGIGIDEIGDRLSGSAKTIRSIFRIGLQAKHGDMTDLETGRIIGDLGPQRAAELLAEAMTAAFPEAAKKGAGDPPAAPAPPGT